MGRDYIVGKVGDIVSELDDKELVDLLSESAQRVATAIYPLNLAVADDLVALKTEVLRRLSRAPVA